MSQIEPYKHDCDRCIWVTWIHVKGGGKYGSHWGNMYYCPPFPATAEKHGSVIIRFSDEPNDYWSSPIGACVKGAIGLGEPLFEADGTPREGLAGVTFCRSEPEGHERVRQAEDAINAARRFIYFNEQEKPMRSVEGKEVCQLLDAYADRWFVKSQGQVEDE